MAAVDLPVAAVAAVEPDAAAFVAAALELPAEPAVLLELEPVAAAAAAAVVVVVVVVVAAAAAVVVGGLAVALLSWLGHRAEKTEPVIGI